MWKLNTDLNKWIKQEDSLSKNDYDNLKQDLQKVRLWSKCLSGSTYLAVNSLDDIYEPLNYSKNFPVVDSMLATSENYVEFYDKYLKDSAFTLKTLFTSTKLISDQLKRYVEVDVATVGEINVGLPIYEIDGIILKEGHRVLVKDQKSSVTLSDTVDPEVYFSTTIPVSNYYEIEDVGGNTTYEYFNSENGIYKMISNKLVRESDLDSYDSAYRFSASVKLGNSNRDRQFHLVRGSDGYYPTVGNVEFQEKHNWVLRNRVDYNNIYDINYYDILHHGPQEVVVDSVSYSVAERTISVGEFGVIINNQDYFPGVSTYSVSNVIDNKYKLNLNSVEETSLYYWVCGNEGTLLRISKIDFSIEIIELGELSNLMSVSFFDDLRGMVVGKFNTVYHTTDGGYVWEKITFSQFESYSYNRVVYHSLGGAYVGGETGVFIEFSNGIGGWSALKRRISKELTNLDEYVLADDINDMSMMKWTGLDSYSYSLESGSVDFSRSLVFNNRLSDDYRILEISLDSPYFGVTGFTDSQFYVSTKITDSVTLGTIYENTRFSNIILSSTPTDYDMYMTASLSNMSFTVSLPTEGGNLRDTIYSVETNIFYDWNGSASTVMSSVSQTYSVSYSLIPYSSDFLLMSTNASKVIVYDSQRIFSPITNDFVYFTFTQSLSDIKTVVRSKSDSMVYVGGDKIYGFDFTDIFGIGTSSNSVEASITDTFDLYANRLYTEGSRMYVAGNNSLLNYSDYIDFYDIDPTFDSRIKSKLLFLDYDIASKLNFFTDEGDYRLPNVISFSQSSMTSSWSYVEVSNLSGEYNWLSYYKDSEKVFPYGFPMDDSNKVEFSTTFSYGTSSSATVTDVYTAFSDISLLAPNLNSSTQSRTLSFSPSTPTSTSVSAVWFYKYLVVFKQPTSWQVGVGDVLLFESDLVDTTFMVNRIYSDAGYNYIYCYSDLNNSIINSIRYSLSSRKLTNLNRYQTISELVERFEKHPVSIGYEIGTDGDLVTLNTRFNNKTAYYNMQSKVRFSVGPSLYDDVEMIYVDSFMNFGYSPTFNLLNYLSNIDSVFDSSKIFYGFAKFDYLPAGELTDGTVWYDYSIPTNKLYFGKNLKFQWTSLLKWTFVDIISTYLPAGEPFYSEKMLIVDKYYDSTNDAYVLEFHKRIVNATSGPLAGQNVGLISIGTRRTLGEISEDLQILNNMQRSTTTREIQTSYQVTNLENEIRFKFPTDSYFRGLISDEDIRQKLSAVVYVDQNSQIAMNVINPDKVVNIDIQSVSDNGDGFVRLDFGIVPHGLVLGSGIVITGTSSYSGYSTVLEILDLTKVKISRTYTSNSTGTVTYTKKDPFLNYIPIDLFDYGSDQKVTRSVEVRPENVVLSGTKYSISNIDTTKYKIRFVDGVYLDEIERSYPWFLEAEVSDAVVGRDSNGLVWYSGIWHCGRWFGGTWISGKWISGDWYSGIWKSLQTTFRIISVEIDNSTVDNGLSKWYGGRWFDGTWYGGTWYGGRRYAGDWNTGLWYNGVWNDGRWVSGLFSGGVWILGKWESGIFNSNSKPSYWLDGEFLSGDFENGVWYDGKFGNTRNLLSRFGTKSTNSRTTVWNGGEWLNGQFHSQLNTGTDGQPAVSDIHKYSVWKTGNWYGGDFWGGVAYNINFFGGVWHGGILEEIQVIGVDSITPSATSNNAIQLNGIFRFNVGDQIWIIDDDRNTVYSPIGSNDSPGSYRINRVVLDQSSDTTKIYLNYNLSTLGVDPTYAGMTVSDVETGLRVVSYFRDSVWESGIWTNGIFETGDFRSGIWYNGIFGGNWGA